MRWYTVLLLLIVAAPAVAETETIDIEASNLDRLGVKFSPAKAVNEQYSRVLPGRVRLPVAQQHMISAPLSGRIIGINVTSGDKVASDTVIAVMESPELLDLQRGFLSAIGKYRLDKEAYTRDKTLFDEGIIAQRRLLEARYTYQQAGARLNETRQLLQIAGMSEEDIAQIESKSKMTNRLEIRAGFSGYVLEQTISIGDYLETGEALFQVGQTNPLWVLVDVAEEQAGRFPVGSSVVIDGCQDTTGKLISVSQSVDPVSQTVQLRVEVHFKADTTPCLKPGQFVQSRIEISQTQPTFEIPATAAINHNGRTYVFVRNKNTVEVRPVTVLSRHEGLLRVQGELDEQLLIAIKGSVALKAAWLGMGGE